MAGRGPRATVDGARRSRCVPSRDARKSIRRKIDPPRSSPSLADPRARCRSSAEAWIAGAASKARGRSRAIRGGARRVQGRDRGETRPAKRRDACRLGVLRAAPRRPQGLQPRRGGGAEEALFPERPMPTDHLPADWRDTLAAGDIVSFTYPSAEDDPALEKRRPCLVLRVDRTAAEAVVAYGTAARTSANVGRETARGDARSPQGGLPAPAHPFRGRPHRPRRADQRPLRRGRRGARPSSGSCPRASAPASTASAMERTPPPAASASRCGVGAGGAEGHSDDSLGSWPASRPRRPPPSTRPLAPRPTAAP